MIQKKKKDLLSKNYVEFLQTIKQRIHKSRIMAYRTVNNELINLYWDIGGEIAQRQEREGWGKSVVERLTKDLQKEFPGTSGFSVQNLWFMRQIYIEYNQSSNLLRLVREIPWGQNITYYLDLLFYHRKLKALVVIELKSGKFKPEYAGKMNFYLNLLNDFVREADENPAIGIILCGDRNRMEVEYALKGIDKPVGVAEYTLTRKLPPQLKGKLPDPKELEKQIMQELGSLE